MKLENEVELLNNRLENFIGETRSNFADIKTTMAENDAFYRRIFARIEAKLDVALSKLGDHHYRIQRLEAHE